MKAICAIRHVLDEGLTRGRGARSFPLFDYTRWPYQPYQCYDENCERVALQRRLPEDDQFVVPHNLLLTVFSPSSVNVVAFDALRGADHARMCQGR